jgi:ABC-type multidrug transport system ATPase subunit
MDIEKEAGQGRVSAVASTSASHSQDMPKLSNCQFGWRGISYAVDTKDGEKQILSNVDGCVEKGCPLSLLLISGQLLALMGPSGCGKTTMLNILSRRLTGSSVRGEQFLAGAPFDDATLRAMSTYVEQEDHLIGSLTVQETIEFAAKLALPGHVGRRERKERTEEMLRDFGLGSVKNTKIGTPLQRGISGGQKRRVTTASQLITLPKIIFLGTSLTMILTTDEPTSGLDSTSSHEIISCLRSTAQEHGVYTPDDQLIKDDRHCVDPSAFDKHPSPLR